MSIFVRRPRVTAIQCTTCLLWVKPRYIRVPAWVCRNCEATGRNQTWKPSPAHLARAYAEVARQNAARQAARGTRRSHVTLAGR